MIRLDNQLGKLEGRVDASLNRPSWFERNVDSRLDASAQRMVQLEQEVARLRLARGTPQTPNTKRPYPINDSVSTGSRRSHGWYSPILSTSRPDIDNGRAHRGDSVRPASYQLGTEARTSTPVDQHRDLVQDEKMLYNSEDAIRYGKRFSVPCARHSV